MKEQSAYTFEEFVQKAGWNMHTQAGVLFEFIIETGQKDALDAFLSERYRWELETDELEEEA